MGFYMRLLLSVAAIHAVLPPERHCVQCGFSLPSHAALVPLRSAVYPQYINCAVVLTFHLCWPSLSALLLRVINEVRRQRYSGFIITAYAAAGNINSLTVLRQG